MTNPAPLTPLERFLRYWLLFVAAVLAPVLLGVPWLDDAVAQVNLFTVSLMGFYFASVTKPLRHGPMAVMRGGVTILALAVLSLFLVAAAYVLRHAAALPIPDGWGQPVAGMAYVGAVHLGAIVLIARFWPAESPAPALRA